MKNTRLWEAVQVLVTGEKDVRHRVADACAILDKMHNSELRSDHWERLHTVLNEAGRSRTTYDLAGNVKQNRYDNTIARRRNAAYVALAAEIFRIYDENERS